MGSMGVDLSPISGTRAIPPACIAEAATKPTDTGVRVAMAQCNRQFPQPTAAQPQQ